MIMAEKLLLQLLGFCDTEDADLVYLFSTEQVYQSAQVTEIQTNWETLEAVQFDTL